MKCMQCKKEIDPKIGYGRCHGPDRAYFICSDCLDKVFGSPVIEDMEKAIKEAK